MRCWGNRKNFESTLQALDGSDHILLWNLSGFADAREFSPAVIIGQDVTARRQAEENMRKLSYVVEQNPISILITDIYGRSNTSIPNSPKSAVIGWKKFKEKILILCKPAP